MIGQQISHYKVLQKLGAGGMGIVYKSEDTKLKRTVAMKFLSADLSRDAEAKSRFFHEARAAATLNHSNIVTVYDIGEHEDQIFIAMEYVAGRTLHDLIHGGAGRDRPLPISEAIAIGAKIAEGLIAAHEQAIVHRDIKSANIMITDKGQVKIMDFGLAKLKGQTKLTREGSTLGTVAYMSPEQAMGKEADPRSDIWSLGVVLFEMVTGQLPFKGNYDQAVLYSILNEEPDGVTSLRSGVPLALERLIAKAMHKEPSGRYQHMDELLTDLRRIETDLKSDKNPISKKITSPAVKRYRRLPLLVGASLFLVSILLLVYLLIFRSGKGEIRTETTPAENHIVATAWENSLAVLPLANLSSDPEQEYFCVGMTDELITRLCKIPELKVISRTSVMRYRDTEKSLQEIARELGVAHILEGSVQKVKQSIRVNVQLIRAADDTHLWADLYDRKLADVFSVQEEITKAIATQLKMTLAAGTLDTAQAERPENTEAYEYYLKGRYMANNYIISRDEADFDAALRMGEKAIGIDPNYMGGYLVLAYAHSHRWAIRKEEKDSQAARFYRDKTIELNPGSPVALSFKVGRCLAAGDRDGAYRFMIKALAAGPNQFEANRVASTFFGRLGLYHQAIPYFIKTAELDPLYPWAPRGVAVGYWKLGLMEKSEAWFKKVLEIAPRDLETIQDYAYMLTNFRQCDRARELLERAKEISVGMSSPLKETQMWGTDELTMKLQAILFATQGETKKAMALLPRYATVDAYCRLGMKEEALAKLKKDISGDTPTFHRWSYLILINSNFLDVLRDDPRFQEIVQNAKTVYEEVLAKYGAPI